MDKDTLRKLQQTQFEILQEINRVCTENEIQFCLIDGTLLGAIRHKGFIPWDDDLDIGMLRADYEKFLEIAPQKMKSGYSMIDWRSDPCYPHPMGKVIKRGTVCKENKRNDHGEQGIWVDIFPFDNVSDLNRTFAWRAFQLKILRALIRAKSRYETWHTEDGFNFGKYMKNLPFRIWAIFLDKKRLVDIYEKISNKDNDKRCKYIFENGVDDYKKWTFKRDYLENLTLGDFEHCKFTIPEQYCNYLTEAYGDYMTLPPENQRENRHQIEELHFG